MTDPIADLLTRIRNALLRGKESVSAPHSKIKHELLKLLAKEGYILGVKKVKRDFPHKFFTTLDDLTGVMKVGQRCFASVSSGGGKILRRNLDLGLVIVDSRDQFQKLENVTNTSYEGVTKTVTTISTGFEYNAPHHYEDGDGNFVDIDPSVGPGALLTEITNYDHYVRQNDKLKQIKVIRPDAVQNVVGSYLEALRS